MYHSFESSLKILGSRLTIIVDLAVAIVIIALSVGGFFLSPPFTLFGLLLLLAPAGHFLLRLTVWLNEQYVITNRRVMEVKGVVHKYVSDSSLEKVNDVVMEQSAAGRLLDYGNIRIITGSDVGVNAFRFIAHPIRFKVAMLDQKSSLSHSFARQATREDDTVVPEGVPEMMDRLQDLKERGVITDEEYEREIKQLLERME